ncbi:MAG: hypothetical protein HDT18_08865 [Oscillibacter sp.]|nr:hypothetical protein [Oscillibacter sp.]
MKRNLPRMAGQAAGLLLTACLLTGCAMLLERSYSVVEPYADRYWDSSAEDTLRVENYQDLVTSLLMLIEERAEEGVIRCYGETGEFRQVAAAQAEVRRETTLGAYLLKDLRFSSESGNGYSTITFHMTYREDAEDLDTIMTLSDTQSLVDLLRLAVREELEKQTTRFTYDTPREDVLAAVEAYWQELYRQELEEVRLAEEAVLLETEGEDELSPEEEDQSPENAEEPPEETVGTPEPEETEPSEQAEEPGAEPPEDDPDGEPEEEPIEYPPCPWLVRFYPDHETAEIVEVILRP